MRSNDWLTMNRSYDNLAKSPKVKYLAAYSTGAERFVFSHVASFAEATAAEGGGEWKMLGFDSRVEASVANLLYQ